MILPTTNDGMSIICIRVRKRNDRVDFGINRVAVPAMEVAGAIERAVKINENRGKLLAIFVVFHMDPTGRILDLL